MKWYLKQRDAMDCGPTCIKMIASYHKQNIPIQKLRQVTEIGKDGANILGISDAAETIGFNTHGVMLTIDSLLKDAPKPAILHWQQNHFVVLAPNSTQKTIIIADPAKGIINFTKAEFTKYWASTTVDGVPAGIALLLEPTEAFYKQETSAAKNKEGLGWNKLFGYLGQQKRFIIQLTMGLIVGSILQLIVPYLTQSIVDSGIQKNDIAFINVILMAQFMLFFSRTIVEFIRSRILLHISTKINLQILSDFWIKLMKLPISYFDSKLTGDILQRLGDHKRIESFLTGTALSTLFSFFNLIVFSFVLLQYNTIIFFIIIIASVLYFGWIFLFLRIRRKLDFKRFDLASMENTATMQLIFGMQEIKLNNAEKLRRWEWESLQAGLFKLSFKGLSYSQIQQAGSFFINEGKNILITFFVAKSVIDGHITLGAMLAVQYIIGQLNGPIEQLIGFAQQLQDAKISLERLNEIHEMEDEETDEAQLIKRLPEQCDIAIKDLEFTYVGAGNEPVLTNICLNIPQGKTTAIVGASGSGKTTLLKLLLHFYNHYKGEIKVGETYLKNISPKYWRSQCGSVMQDGYIFNDSIANNIAVSDALPDYTKLIHACKVANILSFIESLPLGFNTKIGTEGNGISQGQKQRLFIARAVYKNPKFLFFDEATNSLDATNEKLILDGLQEIFKDKTVVVVAHRLSTVKNADNIIVLNKGEIVEHGTHTQLIALKGAYHELVSNQLELGD